MRVLALTWLSGSRSEFSQHQTIANDSNSWILYPIIGMNCSCSYCDLFQNMTVGTCTVNIKHQIFQVFNRFHVFCQWQNTWNQLKTWPLLNEFLLLCIQFQAILLMPTVMSVTCNNGPYMGCNQTGGVGSQPWAHLTGWFWNFIKLRFAMIHILCSCDHHRFLHMPWQYRCLNVQHFMTICYCLYENRMNFCHIWIVNEKALVRWGLIVGPISKSIFVLIIENFLSFDFDFNDQTRTQYCTSCCDMCKIVAWSDHCFSSKSNIFFQDLDYELIGNFLNGLEFWSIILRLQ